MKKTFGVIILLLILIIIIILVQIGNNNNKMLSISEFNKQFEGYENDETLYGADVLTIINKAIDNNNAYDIQKDQEGYYIDDGIYCLTINLILLTVNEKGEQIEITRKMEALQRARIR